MCVVSYVGISRQNHPTDWDKAPDPYQTYPQIWPKIDPLIPEGPAKDLSSAEIEDLVKALQIAKKYDEENDEAECHDPDKFMEFDDLIGNLADRVAEELKKNTADEKYVSKLTRIIGQLKELKNELEKSD